MLSLNAQTIRFNEVVSSNSVYFDEDGDSPDWIELHNYGNQEVSIANWTLTDDVDDYDKWTFPDITLNSNDYLLLWASSKDRSAINYSRTIVNQGDNFKYLVPTNELNSEWKSLSFNDGTWSEGPSGFGYDDGDDATLIPQGSTSLYIRKKFTVDNLSDMASLILDIDYDDGFVAYINGVEIARANINGNPPSYQTTTIQDHEAQMYNGGIPERFSVDDFASILNEGENVIAIQAHNVSSNSSDFT
ncbi:MAG: lamin tail domain-containing protein, partial [Bacteroidetes bacterium]|nr:lamin tail domain-containing protein [Bacteroidota bacterium]